jgi:hypothetical protein
VLFGVEGLQVTDAQALPDGTLEVWAVTGDPAAAACSDCGTVSARRHDTVLARPRDVRRGGDPVDTRRSPAHRYSPAASWHFPRLHCRLAGPLRHVRASRVPGLLRSLRPIPCLRPATCLSQPPGWLQGSGTDAGRFPCSLRIDQLGIQLCPGSIATATPQAFTVASPPTRQVGFGVGHLHQIAVHCNPAPIHQI